MNVSDRNYEYSEQYGHRSNDGQRPWCGNRIALDSQNEQCRETDCIARAVGPQQVDDGCYP
jgi:hypothetical protein